MNPEGLAKLAFLRADFEEVTGTQSRHFFCPVLFRDESVPLCRAHVVNAVFGGEARKWTIQREDVDSFYGRLFESEFVLLRHKGRYSPLDVLSDDNLSKQLRPRLWLNGRIVEHYHDRGHSSPGHTVVGVDVGNGAARNIVVKMAPEALLQAADSDWQLGFEQDLRMPALVSLLKAAHLTLFELLGYRYALTTGGHFLGFEVLGRFFSAHHTSPVDVARDAANSFFREYSHLVRPLLSPPEGLRGTVNDGLLYLCPSAKDPWAALLLVRTGEAMHAVLAPMMASPDAAAQFLSFIKNPWGEIYASLAKFDVDKWIVEKRPRRFEWPAGRFE